MSNALATSTLLTAIISAIQTAAQSFLGTSTPNPIIVYTDLRTEPVIPCAIIDTKAVTVSMTGRAASVANPAQENEFQITIRRKFPSSATDLIITEKVSTANALIAALQTGPVFASIAGFPLVTNVELSSEADNYSTKVYEVTVTFTCTTIASHH